jgi:ribose 1,5-bisphosphokinase
VDTRPPNATLPSNGYAPARRGAWVFVCGPSGAGKDSVIAWARERLADRREIVFARRMITRPPQPGSDHEAVSLSHFEHLAATGSMAWHWQAHGFRYGVSMRYAQHVEQGRIVVVNGSREHALTLPRAAPFRFVAIAASPEKLAARLRQRGRDSPQALAERRQRAEQLTLFAADLEILNDGHLDDAGARLQGWLERLAAPLR